MFNFLSFVVAMNQLLHQISDVFMALLMLFSKVSFSVDLHFCGDNLVDYSFFDRDAKCGAQLADIETAVCPMSLMNCCTDEELVQEGQDQVTFLVQTLNKDQQVFLVSFVSAFLAQIYNYPTETIPIPDYPPPLIDRDFQVLYETFLI